MSLTEYQIIFARNSSGVGVTGLTPVFISYFDANTNVTKTAPAIEEIGAGFYRFQKNVTLLEKAVGTVDFGPTITSGSYRYINLESTLDGYDLNVGINNAYDSSVDTMVVSVDIKRGGQLVTEKITSVTAKIYDQTGTLLHSVADNTLDNGIAIMSIVNPVITKNTLYYIKATIATAFGSFEAIETYTVIE